MNDAWKLITDLGIQAELWETGRRGAHIHVPLVTMEGFNLPYSQMQWVKANLPGVQCDLSIYKVTGQIRLPGAVHEKVAGKCKRLLVRQSGFTLAMPCLTPPPPLTAYNGLTTTSECDTREEWVRACQFPRHEGGRSPHVFVLACRAVEAGISGPDFVEAVARWNRSYCQPAHSEDHIRRKAWATYEQVVRRPHGRFDRVPYSTPEIHSGQE